MAIAGYKGKITYAFSSSPTPPDAGTFAALLGVNDVGYNPTRETLDVATIGGGGAKAYISGLRDASLSLSGDYGEGTGAAGKVLGDAFEAGEGKEFFFVKIYPEWWETTPAPAILNSSPWRFMVSNFNVKSTASGKVTFEASLQPAASS